MLEGTELGMASRPVWEGPGKRPGLAWPPLGRQEGGHQLVLTLPPATPSSSAQRFLTLGAGTADPAMLGLVTPIPRKVGEAFLWAWRQGPLQVKTWPGGGDAGLQHRLSSCGRPSPRLARVPARLPTLAPTHPHWGGRRRAWVGSRRQVPTLLRVGPRPGGQGPAPLVLFPPL